MKLTNKLRNMDEANGLFSEGTELKGGLSTESNCKRKALEEGEELQKESSGGRESTERNALCCFTVRKTTQPTSDYCSLPIFCLGTFGRS